MHCYCNSGKLFKKCCESIISGSSKAKTAEQLMRSRYSAYVVANINYLMNSHHPTTRPVGEQNEILSWTKSVKWLGLEIINKKEGSEMETTGWVEFKAKFSQNGQVGEIHENSFFVKEQGIWFYKSGLQP